MRRSCGQCKRLFLDLNVCGHFAQSLNSDRRGLVGLIEQYKSPACQFQQRQQQRCARTVAWLIREPLGRVDDRADGDLRQLRPNRVELLLDRGALHILEAERCRGSRDRNRLTSSSEDIGNGGRIVERGRQD